MSPQHRSSTSDRIILRGLVFYGYHGVNPEEQKLGQRFRVDITLWTNLTTAATSDDLADTISYAWVYEQVAAIMTGPPSRLLEHAAGQIGQALLADPRIARLQVRILKHDPPIAGMTQGTAGVELTLSQPGRAGS
jgi:dihydroneopterin aldolase